MLDYLKAILKTSDLFIHKDFNVQRTPKSSWKMEFKGKFTLARIKFWNPYLIFSSYILFMNFLKTPHLFNNKPHLPYYFLQFICGRNQMACSEISHCLDSATWNCGPLTSWEPKSWFSFSVETITRYFTYFHQETSNNWLENVSRFCAWGSVPTSNSIIPSSFTIWDTWKTSPYQPWFPWSTVIYERYNIWFFPFNQFSM